MSVIRKTVFVLGAGFTRAFAPAAPLMIDDFGGDRLESDFEKFHHAAHILALERGRNPDRRINIENLMTRLDGRMPYDFEGGAADEIALLLSKVRSEFLRRIKLTKERERHTDELNAFAGYCVKYGVNCITFNYDDLFDEALWRVKSIYDEGQPPYWHPDSGYGFFCRPASSIVAFDAGEMNLSTMLLLKLHGSINWRIRRGYREPYSIDALTHYEEWFPPDGMKTAPEEKIELHLEEEPFIIPPTLNKSALVDQPILRTIWSVAYNKLIAAKEVVFVGYSLPLTDISAANLFSEGIIPGDVRVRVVSRATDGAASERVRETYRRVFPWIQGGDFDFRGALEWARELA
jgi:hypothetical protein